MFTSNNNLLSLGDYTIFKYIHFYIPNFTFHSQEKMQARQNKSWMFWFIKFVFRDFLKLRDKPKNQGEIPALKSPVAL